MVTAGATRRPVSHRGRATLLILLLILVAGAPSPDNRPSAASDVQQQRPSSTPRQVVTAWFHTNGGKALEAMQLNIRDFEAEQDTYAVEMTLVPEGTYPDRIRVAGKTGDLPCLLFVDGPTVSHFAWLGYLQPLDAFVPQELRDDFLQSVITQGTYRDHLYALAVYDAGLGIFGNRRYLKAAGIRIPTVDHPWSVAEFERDLEKLRGVAGVQHPLDLKINYGRGEFFTFAFSPILQSSGGDLIDRHTYRSAKGVLDGPQSVAAMTRMQSWIKKGWVDPHPPDDNAFISGQAALSWVGHWSYARYADALGDDLVLLPLPDFGRGPKTGAGAWMFSISSSCRNPTGAWALLRYTLRRDKILRWTSMHTGIPARKSTLATSPLFRPGGPLNLYVQQTKRGWAIARPITPAYTAITSAFAEAVDDIIKGADVQHELTKAADRIDQDIRTHGGYQ